jgi:hypothetical protein
MRGLNEWLPRDVHDRQAALQGVIARVERLSADIHTMAARGAFSVGQFLQMTLNRL